MQRKRIHYEAGGIKFDGYLAYEGDEKQVRPAVIVAHTWRGQDEFVRQKAEELASLGYVGFAADLFGSGLTAKNDDEAGLLIAPLFQDRQELRKRINAALTEVLKLPFVDKDKIGAIGFCFGGLTVQELLFSGANVKAVVSFHGVIGPNLGPLKAKLAPQAPRIKGGILLLHGHDDPLVSPEDIKDIQKKLTDAKVDWQMNIYGHATHAFTNPEANNPKSGMVYNPVVASRAWKAMVDFFKEKFSA